MKRLLLLAAAAAMLATACSSSRDDSSTAAATTAATTPAEVTPGPAAAPIDGSPIQLVPEIVSTRPHDPSAWTQGLILFGERMFESTGATGATSTLREVDQHSGEILRQVTLDDPLFAEGLERVDDRLIQLTWQDQLAFVYDLESFERLEAIGYVGEGWGLCRDADRLVMSNGSENLQFRDPNTFEEIGERVVVTLEGAPVAMLNELECVDGTVWANVWTTDTIVGIDPTTGVVTAVLDGSALPRPESASVLNGIAYDPATGNYLLTGKHWPDIYEVRLVPRG